MHRHNFFEDGLADGERYGAEARVLPLERGVLAVEKNGTHALRDGGQDDTAGLAVVVGWSKTAVWGFHREQWDEAHGKGEADASAAGGKRQLEAVECLLK